MMGTKDENENNTKCDVVIIGGGIAGISAGSILTQNGFKNFLLLEASDRLGGRIQTVKVGPSNILVELGANWIHGVEANPIFKIARKNNLLSPHYTGKNLGKKIIFATETGEPVHPRIVSDVDLMFGQLMGECEDFYRNQVPTPLEDDSVGAYIEREFEERISSYQGEDTNLRRLVLAQRLIGECTFNGADSMREVSLSEAGCFEDVPGVHFLIPPGFETIIKLLAKEIPENNIRLKSLVTQISWDRPDPNYPIQVKLEDGNCLEAKYCLVTIPLGYLKKHASRLFNPLLPDFKMQAINSIGMGTVDKLILVFDGPVFPEGIFRLEMIWNRKGLGVEEEPDYLSPTRDLSKTWYKKIPNFEAVTPEILVCWVCGKEAEFVESLSDEEVASVLYLVLKGFLSKIVPKMPKLVKVIKSDWKTNPLTLGSYCHIPVGTSAQAIGDYAQPLSNSNNRKVLFFAGEATHPTFYSSSHGAHITGIQQAELISQQLAA